MSTTLTMPAPGLTPVGQQTIPAAQLLFAINGEPYVALDGGLVVKLSAPGRIAFTLDGLGFGAPRINVLGGQICVWMNRIIGTDYGSIFLRYAPTGGAPEFVQKVSSRPLLDAQMINGKFMALHGIDDMHAGLSVYDPLTGQVTVNPYPVGTDFPTSPTRPYLSAFTGCIVQDPLTGKVLLVGCRDDQTQAMMWLLDSSLNLIGTRFKSWLPDSEGLNNPPHSSWGYGQWRNAVGLTTSNGRGGGNMWIASRGNEYQPAFVTCPILAKLTGPDYQAHFSDVADPVNESEAWGVLLTKNRAEEPLMLTPVVNPATGKYDAARLLRFRNGTFTELWRGDIAYANPFNSTQTPGIRSLWVFGGNIYIARIPLDGTSVVDVVPDDSPTPTPAALINADFTIFPPDSSGWCAFQDKSTGPVEQRIWDVGGAMVYGIDKFAAWTNCLYATPGIKNVTLTVIGAGQITTITKPVTVGGTTAPPPPPPPAPTKYALTVNNGNAVANGVAIPDGGLVLPGTKVTISGVPPNHKQRIFVNWTGYALLPFPNAQTTTLTMPSQNVTVTANFKR